jgi:uncharacterized alkaline shock family protein YloU
MLTEIGTDLGRIKIAKDVVAMVAGNAATECYGLVGMASRSVQDGIAELLGRESLSRGVVIDSSGDSLEIELYIIVEYGVNIPEVARNVVEKVRYTMETMLGLKVGRININVQGVRVATAQQYKSTER